MGNDHARAFAQKFRIMVKSMMVNVLPCIMFWPALLVIVCHSGCANALKPFLKVRSVAG